MKKNIIIYLFIAFLTMIFSISKVDATEYATYGFLSCSRGSAAYYIWDDFYSCSYSWSNTASHDGVLKFEADDVGNIKLTQFSDTGTAKDHSSATCDASKITCNNGKCKCGAYDINISQIESYYSKNNTFPDLVTYDCSDKGNGNCIISSSAINVGGFPDIKDKSETPADIVILSKNLSDDSLYSYCPGMYGLIDEVKKANAAYGKDSNEEKAAIQKARDICKTIKENVANGERTTKDPCFTVCMELDEHIAKINPDAFSETNSCGLGQDLVAWLLRILKIIRYIVPVLIIVLSTVEYIGAISSANDDAMKKVGKRFSTRLFILILIFLVPSILQFIFNIFNIPGLSSSDPYCLK